jgi:hypothetical protein
MKSYVLFLVLVTFTTTFAQPGVLIIQDEMPQIETLSAFLEKETQVTIVDQDHLPASLEEYEAVIIFIHKQLFEPTEVAMIDYTKKGGRLILLHHSVSSAKAKNTYFFDFLGIRLDHPETSRYPQAPNEGYAWTDPVTVYMVNLNPNHFIVNHNIEWNDSIQYQSSDQPSILRTFPCIRFPESEVYLNHKFTDGREKTVLCGLKFYDTRNLTWYFQDRAAWIKPQGRGHIVYFLPGHTAKDYENKNMTQMILNAITWNP